MKPYQRAGAVLLGAYSAFISGCASAPTPDKIKDEQASDLEDAITYGNRIRTGYQTHENFVGDSSQETLEFCTSSVSLFLEAAAGVMYFGKIGPFKAKKHDGGSSPANKPGVQGGSNSGDGTGQ